MEINMLPIVDVTAQVSVVGGVAPSTSELPTAEGLEFGVLLGQAMVDVELLPEGGEILSPQGQGVSFAPQRNGAAQDALAMMLRLPDQVEAAPLVLPSTDTPTQNAQQGPSIISAGEETHVMAEKVLSAEPTLENSEEMQRSGLLTAMVAANVLTTTVKTLPKEPVAPTESAMHVVSVDNTRQKSGIVPAVVEENRTVSLPEAAAQNAQPKEIQAMNQPQSPVARPVVQPSTDDIPVAKEMLSEMETAATKTSLQKLQSEPMVRGAHATDAITGKGSSFPAGQLEVSAAKEPAKPAGILARDLAMEVSIAEPAAQADVSGDTGQSLTGSGHEQGSTAVHGIAQHAVLGSKPVEQQNGIETQPTVQVVNHESVIEQVRDRLTSHEVRTDGNQVRLQLNPADLGELQITIRMDDQKLRVEILAENKAVKAALLEHADTLKDVLARQNITVERLEVGTGSQEGLGRFFREGGRPEDQQRPFARLAQHGGFRQEVPGGRTMTAWQPRSNALVDVRF